MKIRITQPGFEGYNGDLCGILFENGVSTRDVHGQELDRLAANMTIEDAVSRAQAGVSARMVTMKSCEMPVQKNFKHGDTPDQQELSLESEPAAKPEPKFVSQPFNVRTYSEQDLGEVADDHGIAGLRHIADELDVHATSIAGLIEKILHKQTQRSEGSTNKD
jgi:hypothetical protein